MHTDVYFIALTLPPTSGRREALEIMHRHCRVPPQTPLSQLEVPPPEGAPKSGVRGPGNGARGNLSSGAGPGFMAALGATSSESRRGGVGLSMSHLESPAILVLATYNSTVPYTNSDVGLPGRLSHPCESGRALCLCLFQVLLFFDSTHTHTHARTNIHTHAHSPGAVMHAHSRDPPRCTAAV